MLSRNGDVMNGAQRVACADVTGSHVLVRVLFLFAKVADQCYEGVASLKICVDMKSGTLLIPSRILKFSIE